MKKMRGYNLVEIAIVLAASLMMGSWLFVNYFEWQNTQRDQEVLSTMEAIKVAVVTYAANHPSAAYTLVNADITTNVVQWTKYAGRPYLPCPDITGDGLEDRRPLPTGTRLSVRAGSSGLEGGGDCYRNKGILPWRTLGVASKDAWGNYFTYRVSPSFSNAIVGFDHQTQADQAYYTRLLSLVDNSATNELYATRPTIARNDTVTRAAAGEVMRVWGAGNIESDLSPTIVCEEAPCGTGVLTTSLAAGILATASLAVRTGGYDLNVDTNAVYTAGDIISGVSYVIVSHGRNGYGAAHPTSGNGFSCYEFPDTTARRAERQNAFWRTGLSATLGDAVYNCAELLVSGSGQHAFVAHPRDAGEGEVFDDVVSWVSVEVLRDQLRAVGALPVELLPPVGLEDH